MGPYAEVNHYPFDLGGIAGIRRFLERVYGLTEHVIEKEALETTRLLHKTIKKVSEDILDLKFNTAISAMMIYINQAEKVGLSQESYETFITVLSPFAPHICEELWNNVHSSSIHSENFPIFDESLTKDESVTIGVQINGTLRGDVTISPEASETEAVKAVEANEKFAAKLQEGSVAKIIYVPGRILNFIIK
jgi:leucyl-tRNA synthetase